MPGQAIAIDKSLSAGKVQNPIRQYLPNKHAQLGISKQACYYAINFLWGIWCTT